MAAGVYNSVAAREQHRQAKEAAEKAREDLLNLQKQYEPLIKELESAQKALEECLKS
jgi:hypothetical protein